MSDLLTDNLQQADQSYSPTWDRIKDARETVAASTLSETADRAQRLADNERRSRVNVLRWAAKLREEAQQVDVSDVNGQNNDENVVTEGGREAALDVAENNVPCPGPDDVRDEAFDHATDHIRKDVRFLLKRLKEEWSANVLARELALQRASEMLDFAVANVDSTQRDYDIASGVIEQLSQLLAADSQTDPVHPVDTDLQTDEMKQSTPSDRQAGSVNVEDIQDSIREVRIQSSLGQLSSKDQSPSADQQDQGVDAKNRLSTADSATQPSNMTTRDDDAATDSEFPVLSSLVSLVQKRKKLERGLELLRKAQNWTPIEKPLQDIDYLCNEMDNFALAQQRADEYLSLVRIWDGTVEGEKRRRIADACLEKVSQARNAAEKNRTFKEQAESLEDAQRYTFLATH